MMAAMRSLNSSTVSTVRCSFIVHILENTQYAHKLPRANADNEHTPKKILTTTNPLAQHLNVRLEFSFAYVSWAYNFWAAATNPPNRAAVQRPITNHASGAANVLMAGLPGWVVLAVARWPMKASNATAAPPLIRIRDLMVSIAVSITDLNNSREDAARASYQARLDAGVWLPRLAGFLRSDV